MAVTEVPTLALTLALALALGTALDVALTLSRLRSLGRTWPQRESPSLHRRLFQTPQAPAVEGLVGGIANMPGMAITLPPPLHHSACSRGAC